MRGPAWVCGALGRPPAPQRCGGRRVGRGLVVADDVARTRVVRMATGATRAASPEWAMDPVWGSPVAVSGNPADGGLARPARRSLGWDSGLPGIPGTVTLPGGCAAPRASTAST